MKVWDQGFRRFFGPSAEALIRQVLKDVTDIEAAPPELAMEPELEPDSLFRVIYHGKPCLVNVEIQSSNDRAMPRRMFEYGARASIVYGLPIISIVVWLFQEGVKPTSPYEMRVEDWLTATWHFHSIELYKWSPSAIMEAGVPELLPLAPFTQGATAELAEQAMQRLQAEMPEKQASILGALLAVFLTHFYPEEVAEAIYRRYFHMSPEIIKEFPMLQRWVDTAKAEGKAIGKAIGELEGMREVIQGVLESRFGPLSEDILQALGGADEATLKGLVAHVANDALEQIRERLRAGEIQG